MRPDEVKPGMRVWVLYVDSQKPTRGFVCGRRGFTYPDVARIAIGPEQDDIDAVSYECIYPTASACAAAMRERAKALVEAADEVEREET